MALTKAKLIELFDSGQLDDYMGGGALGNITPDGKVGTTADLTLMTGPGGLVVARTRAEAIAIWKFTNPNLLHNWDFRNPVNQREFTAFSPSGGSFYTIDRWYVSTGTYATKNSDNLQISNGACLQVIENGDLLAGRVFTFTLMDASGVFHSCNISSPTVSGAEDNHVTLSQLGVVVNLGYYMNKVWSSFTVGSTPVQIKAVKLELGTVSTLAYDPPMDYGTELAKCQRYFQVIDTIPSGFCISGFGDNTETVRLLYNAPVPFRGPITVAHSGVLPIANASGGLTGFDIASISQALSAQNNSMVTLLCTANGAISAGTIYIGHFQGGRIALSSDL